MAGGYLCPVTPLGQADNLSVVTAPKRVFSVSEFIAIATFVGAIVIWGVRLEGRINVQDLAITSLKENSRETFRAVRSDLAYIRQRIDAATQGEQ